MDVGPAEGGEVAIERGMWRGFKGGEGELCRQILMEDMKTVYERLDKRLLRLSVRPCLLNAACYLRRRI